MEKWHDHSLLRQELVDRRCRTADEVAMWVKDTAKRSAQNTASNPSAMSSAYAMISANAALVLINVACGLLNRQISALANEFEQKGGFSERMYRVRSNRRK
ncbi:four helix bundle suffix domain protein [Limihaloglobus sulfuriphilus]|uniref:Four helix bundle suffix domain protein n=1 Tax=Limihaloglobus sulfuriphilus TaxID=1851148 RepID=A0A1Q2MHN5_9BACT|nr:four helix bundle suffix domain-containing protein [Limihaloglobus sulfuriphilus]AQQ72201.1 four helix bundle suffix domain protein [Limihaloglobus sulfuriphilus]